jgi:hypothetical protein
LVHFDVSSNSIDTIGFIYLFDALKRNESVVSLDISSKSTSKNRINLYGIQQFARMLEQNKVLSHIDLHRLNTKSEGFEIVLNEMCNNKRIVYLNMSSNSITGTPSLGAKLSTVLQSSELKEIILSDNKLGNGFIQSMSLGMAEMKPKRIYLENAAMSGKFHLFRYRLR